MADLEREINDLKLRVENLEKIVSGSQEKSASPSQTVDQNLTPIERNKVNTKKPEKNIKPFWLDQNLESQIGGTLLNRIGLWSLGQEQINL